MEKLYLIDAYALIFKFYYAFISRPMRNNEGLNTSPIFGFTKFINDLISNERPSYLGVAFDTAGGNFRHELYPLYKANRGETPEDIIAATPHIKRILRAMQIPVLEMKGYEADDIIGTIAKRAAKDGFDVYMVTPDKDYGQLIDDNIHMYKPSKSGSGIDIVGKDKLCENYGISSPQYIIDILALWGDASDNIPGVPGIGEKTAIKLINEFGDIEQIIANSDKIKGKNGQNIRDNVEQLRLSKQLATIEIDVPIAYESDKLHLDHPDYTKLRELYREMNFGSLMSTIDFWERCRGVSSVKADENSPCNQSQAQQLDLFGEVVSESGSAQKSDLPPTPQILEPAEELDLFSAIGEQIDVKLSNVTTTDHKYTTITTIHDQQSLVAMLMTHSIVAFDTETTDLDPLNARLVGMSFSTAAHEAYYVPLNADNNAITQATLNIFRPFFESNNITKVGQNIKYDMLVLNSYGVEVNGFLIDTMIVHYLLDSDSRHGMDFLSEKYLKYEPIPISDLIGKGSKQITMDKVDVNIVSQYACEDADVTYQLYEILWKELLFSGMERLYREIEEPLIRVLASMEFKGVALDTDALNSYAIELTEELNVIESKIYEIATYKVNINSPKQLGELLFEQLKIDDKPKRTKTKQYKTDEEYLRSLVSRHEVVEMILEYRSLKKLLSTYVEALPLLVNRATGRIHTTYNQAVASTGRLSSNNPNLQNIPIRDERGKHIRRAFVAQDNDSVILSADYSQVELRIMAVLSQDENMIDAFNKGEDIHTATAAKIYGIEIAEVTTEQRRRAKTANFGIIYGISAFGLSQRLGISRKEANELIEGYFMHYPKVKEYMDSSIASSREKGYCTTLFNRRKMLADIGASNAIVRGYAERNAINAPIQGSAADIIKIAMIHVSDALHSGGYESSLIMQVHDELILEVKNDELDSVTRIVVDAMENVVDFAVKLVAEYGVGHSWLDAH